MCLQLGFKQIYSLWGQTLLNTDFEIPIPPALDTKDAGTPTTIEQTNPKACLPILVH